MKKERNYKSKLINVLRSMINKRKDLSNGEELLNLLMLEVINDCQIQIKEIGKNNEVKEYEIIRNSIIKAVSYRDNLLQVINQVAATLLKSDPDKFVYALHKSMELMAKAVDVNRVYIWQNHIKDNELYCTQIYEWSEDVESQQNNEYTVDIPYKETYPELVNLADGHIVNGKVKNLAEDSKAHLTAQGILSVLIMPIFINNEFWGFVGFDDCQRERIFTKEEESILHSASLLIANSFLRNERILNIREISAKLETALEEANAASKYKSEFLSTMSHEIRTPMNAIIGMTAIGKKANEIKEKDYALKRIEGASKHLLGVINDILDIAKIEANKLELSFVDFSFKNMIKRVIDIVDFQIKEMEQQFELFIDEKIPAALNGDDQRLSQVITNLISNAIKFTPSGGKIALDVKLHSQTDDKYYIQFNVSDNGIGISDEQKGRLFNSFEQADCDTTRKFGGTGLGLSISKNIVEMMNGKIWAESEINKGTTFSFIVSLNKVKENNFEDNVDAEVNLFEDFSNHTILLAEDHQINREIILCLLGDTNINIDVAVNGEEAFNMFKDYPDKYELIFMDIEMPKMDGLTATKYIRNLDMNEAKTVPIVAMTANVFKKDIDMCLEVGMNDHIGKPINVEEILGVLKKYLKHSRKRIKKMI